MSSEGWKMPGSEFRLMSDDVLETREFPIDWRPKECPFHNDTGSLRMVTHDARDGKQVVLCGTCVKGSGSWLPSDCIKVADWFTQAIVP